MHTEFQPITNDIEIDDDLDIIVKTNGKIYINSIIFNKLENITLIGYFRTYYYCVFTDEHRNVFIIPHNSDFCINKYKGEYVDSDGILKSIVYDYEIYIYPKLSKIWYEKWGDALLYFEDKTIVGINGYDEREIKQFSLLDIDPNAQDIDFVRPMKKYGWGFFVVGNYIVNFIGEKVYSNELFNNPSNMMNILENLGLLENNKNKQMESMIKLFRS